MKWLRIGKREGFYEHGNELLRSIRVQNILTSRKVSTFQGRQWPRFWSTHHDGAIYLYLVNHINDRLAWHGQRTMGLFETDLETGNSEHLEVN